MSLGKRIIMNIGSSWANMFVVAVVGLILVPVVLSKLGESAFGVWALLSYGLTFPVILENAFSLALNRFVAFYRDDSGKMNQFISASFVILSGMAVITVVVAVIFSFIISDLFEAITDELADEAQVTCILVGVTLACRMIGANFSGVLQGYQFYTRYNAAVITGNIVRLIVTLSALVFWRSMVAVQLAYVVAAISTVVLMLILVCRTVENYCISIRLVNKAVLRELWRYTSHSIARSGGTIVMNSVLTLLVGWKGTSQNVTTYNIASRLPGVVRGLLAGAQNVFLPAVSSLCASGQIQRIKSLVKRASQASMVLTCILYLLLFIFAREILSFWLRYAVSDDTVLVMRVFIIALVPAGFFEIWLPVLVGIGHLTGLTIAAISTAVCAILLAFVFLMNDVSTPMASAMALVAVMWIKTGFWLPLYGLHKIGIDRSEYFRESLLRPLTAAAVSIMVLFGLSVAVDKINIHWLIMLFGYAVIVTVIFVSITFRKEFVNLLITVRLRFRNTKKDCT